MTPGALLLPLEALGGYDLTPLFADAGATLALVVGLALLAATLLVARWRRAGNPVLWIGAMLAAGGGATLARHPVVATHEAAFFARDPGYAAMQRPFDGRSLWVPRPCLVSMAAHRDMGNSLHPDCELPLPERVADGTLDWFEAGTDPVHRFRRLEGDPRCFEHGSWEAEVRTTILSAPLAVCVRGDPVAAAEATHMLEHVRLGIPPPSDWWYTQIRLVRRADGAVLDRFDGWAGATPYAHDADPPEPRRPAGPLADLLRPSAPSGGTSWAEDLGTAALLLRGHRVRPDLLVAAMGAPRQKHRALAYAFACRDDVRPLLSPAEAAAIDRAAEGLWGEAPARFPEDCAPWMRAPRDGVRIGPDGTGRPADG